MTIGVDFHIYKRNHGDKSISFQIWDLSGQEHFQRMQVFDKYVQGSHIYHARCRSITNRYIRKFAYLA